MHAHTSALRLSLEVGCSYWRIPAPSPTARPAPPALSHSARSVARQCHPTAATGGGNGTAGGGAAADPRPPPRSLREEARRSNEEVHNRLADVFSERKPEEWRKLIAYSTQWPSLAAAVLDILEARAASAEDEERQRALRRIARRLRTVSQELEQYRELVETFRAAPSREWEPMVMRHRPALGAEFFDYLELRIRSAASKAAAAEVQQAQQSGGAAQQVARPSGGAPARHPLHREAEALAALAAQLAVLVEAHDRVVADAGALEAAGERFAELLRAESMPAAEAQLDALAAAGKLDPALLLTMARAYAGVKETDKTREEVKDIMAHLYFKAKESFAAQAPPEARILKFLLAVDDPKERGALLDMAFQPGAPLATVAEDYLHTTPPVLLNTVENVLAVYEGGRGGGGGTMAGQASALMNPEVIQRLRDLQKLIRSRYM